LVATYVFIEKYMAFIIQIIILFSCVFSCANQPVVDDILQLRSIQRHASYDTGHAIDVKIAQLKKEESNSPLILPDQWLSRILLFFSECTVQLLFVIIVWLLIVFSWFSLFPYYRYVLWLLLVYVLISIIARYATFNHSRILVIAQDAPVYAGPSDNFAQLYSLRYLQEAIYTKRADSWYCVSGENGSGWIAAQVCREVR
jgi:hypothetical protein